MEDSGETKDDVKLPDNNIGKEIKTKFKNPKESFVVTIVTACGLEMAIGVKSLLK